MAEPETEQLTWLRDAARRYGISHDRMRAFSREDQQELLDLFARQRAVELHEALRVSRGDPLRLEPAPNSPAVRRRIDTERGLARLLL